MCEQDSGGFQMVSLLKLAEVTEVSMSDYHFPNYTRFRLFVTASPSLFILGINSQNHYFGTRSTELST